MSGLTYQPFCPFGAHVPLLCELSKTRVRIYGGAMKLQLKSNVLFNLLYTDSLGLSNEGRIMFRVIYACFNRGSQLFMGNSVLVENKPMMKCSLRVVMDLSVAFH